jgi:hypothetical protein
VFEKYRELAKPGLAKKAFSENPRINEFFRRREFLLAAETPNLEEKLRAGEERIRGEELNGDDPEKTREGDCEARGVSVREMVGDGDCEGVRQSPTFKC